MQPSLEHPEKLDLITFDPDSGEYGLIISAMETWDDSEEEQTRLLQKINNYIDFVIDGELLRNFPQSKGKPVRIQIDTGSSIPPNAGLLITQAQKLLSQHGIRLCINVINN